MIITHTILATGHYVNIQKNNITLSILTGKGRASELAVEASEMRIKANRLIRNADIIREAIDTCELKP